jgi:hypothetical protein
MMFGDDGAVDVLRVVGNIDGCTKKSPSEPPL